MRIFTFGLVGFSWVLLSCGGAEFTSARDEPLSAGDEPASSSKPANEDEDEDEADESPQDDAPPDTEDEDLPNPSGSPGSSGGAGGMPDEGSETGGTDGGGSDGGGGHPGGAGGGGDTGGSGGGGSVEPAPECSGETQGCVVDWVGDWADKGAVDGKGQEAKLTFAAGITSHEGYVYISDNHAIRRISIETAEVETIAGRLGDGAHRDGEGAEARFDTPKGIATNGHLLWIVDAGNDVVRSLDLETHEVKSLGQGLGRGESVNGAPGQASANLLVGLAYDGRFLFLADRGADAILRVEPNNGSFLVVAGGQTQGLSDGAGPSAHFNGPTGMTAIGPAKLFVADTDNHRPRVLVKSDESTDGQLSVSSPFGAMEGYKDGIGTGANFRQPRSLTHDGDSLIVSDSENFVLRAINLETRRVTTIAGQPGKAVHAEGLGTKAGFDKPAAVHFDEETGDLFISEGSVLRRMYYK